MHNLLAVTLNSTDDLFRFLTYTINVGLTRTLPVAAALVVIYLQFPIQVCFPCSASPSPTLLPSQTPTSGVHSSSDECKAVIVSTSVSHKAAVNY